jgi:hypothetical protein
VSALPVPVPGPGPGLLAYARRVPTPSSSRLSAFKLRRKRQLEVVGDPSRYHRFEPLDGYVPSGSRPGRDLETILTGFFPALRWSRRCSLKPEAAILLQSADVCRKITNIDSLYQMKTFGSNGRIMLFAMM